MNFKQLKENLKDKTTVVATFGRFNPPTLGHKILFDKVLSESKSRNCESIVFLSQSSDSKRNPLKFNDKLNMVSEMFPEVSFDVRPIQSLWDALIHLEQMGYKNVIFVAGGDRIDKYNSQITKYLDGKIKFESLQFVNAGDRNPDSYTASGISSTLMRYCVKAGDYETFTSCLPKNFKHPEKLFNLVREGLSLAPLLMFRRDSPPEKMVGNDPGTYSSLSIEPLSGMKLYNLLVSQHVQNVEPIKKMHCTVVYSEKSIDNYSPFIGTIKLDPQTYHWDIFNGFLVLRFESPILQTQYEKAKSLGAESTHPTYCSHITLSKRPGKIDINNLELPNFPIILRNENVETLNEMWERNRKEKILFENDPLMETINKILFEDDMPDRKRRVNANLQNQKDKGKKSEPEEIIIDPDIPAVNGDQFQNESKTKYLFK